MGSWYILWRRTALLAIGGSSNEAQEVCSLLTFPIQLFDDLFTDLLFLSVKPFSALFVGMIVFYFMRDIIRDSGYGWKALDWMRGKRAMDIRFQSRDLLLRYHLGEQNLLSELLAGIVVPVAVACDYVFSELEFGANTITKGMTSREQIGVLQMYGVLLCVEIVTHVIVRRLLKRQLSALRTVIESDPHSQIGNYGPGRRLSIMNTSVVWNCNSHNREYWNRHFSYFMCMVLFTVTSVFYFSTTLKNVIVE